MKMFVHFGYLLQNVHHFKFKKSRNCCIITQMDRNVSFYVSDNKVEELENSLTMI